LFLPTWAGRKERAAGGLLGSKGRDGRPSSTACARDADKRQFDEALMARIAMHQTYCRWGSRAIGLSQSYALTVERWAFLSCSPARLREKNRLASQ
jgi:hypothetical protein